MVGVGDIEMLNHLLSNYRLPRRYQVSTFQVSFRGMATELKDYESHYDRLEIHPECTKTEIRYGTYLSFSALSIKLNFNNAILFYNL